MKGKGYGWNNYSNKEKEEQRKIIQDKATWEAVDRVQELCKEYRSLTGKIRRYHNTYKLAPQKYLQRQDEINTSLYKLIDEGV